MADYRIWYQFTVRLDVIFWQRKDTLKFKFQQHHFRLIRQFKLLCIQSATTHITQSTNLAKHNITFPKDTFFIHRILQRVATCLPFNCHVLAAVCTAFKCKFEAQCQIFVERALLREMRRLVTIWHWASNCQLRFSTKWFVCILHCAPVWHFVVDRLENSVAKRKKEVVLATLVNIYHWGHGIGDFQGEKQD